MPKLFLILKKLVNNPTFLVLFKELPFKSDKNAEKGKYDSNTRATQFEKIILGNGINEITQDIFPNNFVFS